MLNMNRMMPCKCCAFNMAAAAESVYSCRSTVCSKSDRRAVRRDDSREIMRNSTCQIDSFCTSRHDVDSAVIDRRDVGWCKRHLSEELPRQCSLRWRPHVFRVAQDLMSLLDDTFLSNVNGTWRFKQPKMRFRKQTLIFNQLLCQQKGVQHALSRQINYPGKWPQTAREGKDNV